MQPKTIVYEQLRDAEIIDFIVTGDELALSYLLIDRCGSRLKYLCDYKFHRLGIEFSELVSETFMILQAHQWKALRDFRGENENGQACKLENYISVIVSRHLYKNMGKSMKEGTENLPLSLVEGQLTTGDPGQGQLSRDVLDAVRSINNPRERAVILLYKLGGHPVEEVTKLLGITPANLYTLCNRAMAHLRVILEERGIYG